MCYRVVTSCTRAVLKHTSSISTSKNKWCCYDTCSCWVLTCRCWCWSCSNIVCPTCRTPFVGEDNINEENAAGEDNGEEEEDGSNAGDDDADNSSSEDDDEDQEVVIIRVHDDAESGDDSDMEMDAEHDAERNVWPGPHRQ